jgi:GR25 family glycosyltransferase involved in LPS biosynthesis
MRTTFFSSIIFYFISNLLSESVANDRHPRSVSNASCNWDSTADSNPSVYWINMEGSTDRRQYMEDQLKFLKFRNQRVTAVTPASPTYNISELQKPCNRNTEKDISSILSHLTAIHNAIYSEESTSDGMSGDVVQRNLRNKRNRNSEAKRPAQPPKMSDYALIIEDDVQFVYQLNFSALISSAPENFGILQLSTSNEEALKLLWSTFKEKSAAEKETYNDLEKVEKQNFLRHYDKNLTARERLWTQNLWTSHTKDGRTSLFWSAQAYLINKRIIKPFIDDVVERHTGGSLSFKIINSFNPSVCKRTKKFPCILANCLFSDTYIYAGGGPTYVTNIPLFTGAAVGLKSDMHQNQVGVHKKGFERMDNLIGKVRRGYNAIEFAEREKFKSSIPAEHSFSDALIVPSFIMNPRTCVPSTEVIPNSSL